MVVGLTALLDHVEVDFGSRKGRKQRVVRFASKSKSKCTDVVEDSP